jgi:WASH complex subunit strumpellin
MLRTVFLKMSSIMDTPLLHISNAGSTDFDSVANYYSTQLLDYVQRVL